MSCVRAGPNDCRTNDRAVRKSNQVATGIRYCLRGLASKIKNPFVFVKAQMKLISAVGRFPIFRVSQLAKYHNFVCLKVSPMQQRAHPKLSRNAHKSPPTATAMLRTCSIKQRLYANIDKVNIELEKITQSSLKCEYPLKAPRKLIKIPSQVRISPTME